MTPTDRTTLQLLYDFIDSALADGGRGPKEARYFGMTERKDMRVYARSFVGKLLAGGSADQDYSVVLPAILGQWCVHCSRFTTPCTGGSADCHTERHCAACGRSYVGERNRHMSAPRMLLVQGDETPPGQMGIVWTFRCGMTLGGSRCLSWFNMFGDLGSGTQATQAALDAGWRMDGWSTGQGWCCPACGRLLDESRAHLERLGVT